MHHQYFFGSRAFRLSRPVGVWRGKAALDGFNRVLARELGARNIRVNSVAPGDLRTDMTHDLDSDQLDQIVRRTPLQRLGMPADVVPLALFLASDKAQFITGQVIAVDGGLTA
jgi:3-oxoacyl-[acyl-carrier protein] reductase